MLIKLLEYERSYPDTRIAPRKEAIIQRMETYNKAIHMPKLGTTVID